MRRQRTGEVGCRAEARRVQSMVKMKPAGSPRAATRPPAEARCRAEARDDLPPLLPPRPAPGTPGTPGGGGSDDGAGWGGGGGLQARRATASR